LNTAVGGNTESGCLVLLSCRVCGPLMTPLGFPLLHRASLSLWDLANPEDRSNQASLVPRGGFRSHLGHLISSTEEEKCRIIERCIMSPPDSSMSFIEMAIGYTRTEDNAVRERIASFLIPWVPVM